MPEVKQFYRKIRPDFEYCFNIETSAPLSTDELVVVRWLLAETFELESFREKSFLEPVGYVVEIGPRLSFETAYSTNAVAICHACGLESIRRVEISRRYLIPSDVDRARFITVNHDRMTECPYT